ncbi:MAG: TolC family protein [Proteobacteria bacterium]|nr:TolC family protein [Pseudomonadota bacterium]
MFKYIAIILLLFVQTFCCAVAIAQPPIVITSAQEKELTNILPLPQATIHRTKSLTLEDAIVLALRNNPAVRSSRLQRIMDRYALELANYAFEPQFKFSSNVTFTQGERTGYNVNPSISLNTPWGTQLSLNNTMDLQGHQQEELHIVQPLLRGFGEVNKIPWLNAQDNEIIARENFKSSIMDMITQVINQYRRVVQDENNLKVEERSLKRAETTANQYQLRVKSGKMAPSELLQEQSTLANNRLDIMRDRNAAQINYQTLLDTLGLSPNSKLKLDSNINFKKYRSPSQQEAIDTALKHNPKYVTSKIGLEATRRALISAKDALRWDLTASGSLNFMRTHGSVPVISGFDSLSYSSKPTATIEISIPIRDIEAKSSLVSAQIAYINAQDALEQSRRSLIRDVITSLNDLNSQLQQLNLAEQALVLQRKNLQVEQIKQQYGQTTALNVNIIQDTLLQQEIEYVNSQINYLNSVTAFQNLLGTTLQTWNIHLVY